MVVILGQNTHFTQGNEIPRVWLAQGSATIEATSTFVQSNTELRSNFNIPFSARTGLWNLSVQSSLDGNVTLANGFAILLAAPSQLLATGISSRQINLNWRDNSGTEQGYRLERKRDGAGAYEELATVAASMTTFADDSLTPPPYTVIASALSISPAFQVIPTKAMTPLPSLPLSIFPRR
jgi:hypothetical protein